MAYNALQVGATPNYGPGNQLQGGGPQGDAYVSEWHGRYFSAARSGKMFVYAASAVTIAYMHLGTAGAQAFALWNPVGSGVNAELLWTDVGFLSGTTVVDAIGWYLQNASHYPPTSPTPAASQNALFGAAGGQVVPYSALTFAASSSPTLMSLVGVTPTTTTVSGSVIHKIHEGSLILPPGTVAYLGASAAATAAGSAEVSWIETSITSGF